MMKQWTTLMDGIDRLRLEHVPMPAAQKLKGDEVLVKISRVSINYRDSQLITGAFKGRYATPEVPLVPCSDAAGFIVAVGTGGTAAKAWKVGDRVFGLVRPTHLSGPTRAEHHASGLGIPQPGVATEYRIFSASGILRVPQHMAPDEACTLPIAAITAWMALNWDQQIGHPRMGLETTVLLQGTGGVSIAALQQAHALGLRTIVTSSDSKLHRAKELGAHHLINYKTTPDWADEVLKLTEGKGADIIIETGGPGTIEQSLRAVSEGGNISAVGILTGNAESKSQTPIGLQLISRNATLKGINIGPKDRMEEMLEFYAEERIRPLVGKTFAYENFAAAIESLKTSDHFGKVVIKVD